MTLVRVERRESVAVLTLDRPRANAFSPELVADLRSAIRDRGDARAAVLASSQKIFSGGWDLPTIVSFDRTEMTGFVDDYTGLVRDIFSLDVPVVAALPGHAIAGGLILAAAADERIAAEGEPLFGLSEVALGVPLPRSLFEVFRFLLGERPAERLAATAVNLPIERALAMGLVDEAVPPGDLLDRACERAAALGEPLGSATAGVKRWARREALARFDAARSEDPFLDSWFGEPARSRIAALVEKLTRKR